MTKIISSDWNRFEGTCWWLYTNHLEALDDIIPMVNQVFDEKNFNLFYMIDSGLGYRLGFGEDLIQNALNTSDEYIADHAKGVYVSG